MRRAVVLFYVTFLLTSTTANVHADPADSVVKVTSFIRPPDPTRPWEKGKPVEGSGSGVYIGGNRILTNAHVVHFATEITVQWKQGGQKADAKVEAISLELDLALLTVADKPFFAKHPPLTLAKQLPKVKDSVTTYGFPRGGAGLSVTKGEVSRINSIGYGPEGHGLQIQISAPVNRGNSGGPAVVGDTCIGLVTSTLVGAQNTNYIVPAEEIHYFLTHVKEGRFVGKPRINTRLKYQGLENNALRRSLGIDRAVEGILIFGAAEEPFHNLDVVTKIGDKALDNRGNIQLDHDLSAFFLYMVPKLAKNNAVPITVRRGGKDVVLKVPVQFEDPHILKRYHREQLPYLIHGPLVFVPAKSEDVLDFYSILNPYYSESPLMLRAADFVRFPGEELVVISTQFRSKITNGYMDHSGKVVKAINGTPIKNLRHLVETVRDCKSAYLKIEFAEKSAGLMVFDRAAMEAVTHEIIDEIGIAPTRRGSPDMMRVWNEKK
jgi:S1-C subfamily serine protease